MLSSGVRLWRQILLQPQACLLYYNRPQSYETFQRASGRQSTVRRTSQIVSVVLFSVFSLRSWRPTHAARLDLLTAPCKRIVSRFSNRVRYAFLRRTNLV